MFSKKIPNTIEEAVDSVINSLVKHDLIVDVYNMDFVEFSDWVHEYELANEMCEKWGFWIGETNLYKCVRCLGVWDSADMVSIIMTQVWSKMHMKPVCIRDQAKKHIKYRLAQEIEME